MIPDLIKVTEIFLVPSSFLVAALGTADTNPHRTMVSILGLVVSLLWQVASREALLDVGKSTMGPPNAATDNSTRPIRIRVLGWLPFVFIGGWFLSVIAHALSWNSPMRI